MKTLAFLTMTLLLGVAWPGSAAEPKKPVEPPIIDPGPLGGSPSDAIVLFSGKDLSQWKNEKGGDPKWRIEEGGMVVNGTGSLISKETFGDCQLHVEWATPSKVEGDDQGRGNSGVYLQGRYEIQVLDSYNNKTYFDGQAGRITATRRRWSMPAVSRATGSRMTSSSIRRRMMPRAR